MIIGLFAGIAVCMAALHSLAQAILAEGAKRWAHLAQLVAILAVMAALLEREVALARLLAVALIAAALWVMVMERGWYRIFPLLVQVFAAVLIAGYVAFAP